MERLRHSIGRVEQGWLGELSCKSTRGCVVALPRKGCSWSAMTLARFPVRTKVGTYGVHTFLSAFQGLAQGSRLEAQPRPKPADGPTF